MLVSLVLVGATWFVYRGSVLALRGPQEDLTSPYGMARAWLLRQDPYDHANLLRAVGDASNGVVWWVGQPVYPPTTIVVLAPYASLPWASAAILWHICLVTSYLLSAVVTARWAGLDKRLVPAALFMFAILVFAPAHTGLIVSNAGVLSGSLAVIATVLALPPGRRRALVSGVILGIATAIKPQVAAPFWSYFVLTRRWTAASAGAIVPSLIFAAIAWDLSHLNPRWPTDLRAHIDNIEPILFEGYYLRPFGRIHLAVLVEFFTRDPRWVSAIVAALLMGPAVFWCRHVWRHAPRWRTSDARAAELVALTPLLGLSLLAAYHRPYDAVVLVPALAWVVWELTTSWRAASRATWMAGVTLVVAFIGLPWVTVLALLDMRGILPHALGAHPVFQFVVLAHPTWALLVLTAAGLWRLTQIDGSERDQPTGTAAATSSRSFATTSRGSNAGLGPAGPSG